MKIDASLPAGLTAAAATAAALEERGFDGVFTSELAHDPFLPLALAAAATGGVDLGTSVAVAFARNPMLVAGLAADLHQLSGGRFLLGLGSQVRSHITRRFSMPWSEPALRMREFITTVRSIWAGWQDGRLRRHVGRFYTHDLMTPMFDPGPSPVGYPPILLAAVGPEMTRTAAEVADGLIVHSFTSAAYLREVTVPRLRAELTRAGRDPDKFTIAMAGLFAIGRDEPQVARRSEAVRRQIAFYGATREYRAVLAHHGWDDLAGELSALARERRWDQMTALIDDEALHAFAIVGTPDVVAPEIGRRFGGAVGRLRLPVRCGGDAGLWDEVIARLRS
jgi:probable F420-dependent oxidoreductase